MIPTSENLTGVRPLQDGPEPDSVSPALGNAEAGSGVSEDAGREEKDGTEEEVGRFCEPLSPQAIAKFEIAMRAIFSV